MATSRCHQSRVWASDYEACFSIATHHAVIKIDLKKSQSWELSGNKYPMGRSKSWSETLPVQIIKVKLADSK